MDEDDTNDCADWELLQTEEITGTIKDSRSCGHMNGLSGVGVSPVAPGSSKDNWIYPMGELSLELSTDRYDDGKSVDLDASNEPNSEEDDGSDVSTEVNLDESDNLDGSIGLNLDVNDDLDVSNELNLDENDVLDASIELNFDENETEREDFDEIETFVVKSEDSVEPVEMKSGESQVEAVKSTTEEEKRKSVLWWKASFNFFKCCAIRFKPIWTLSAVAAIMCFVIFRQRRLRLKNKSLALKLKVTIDENKEARLMNHVVRINEAFSLVRRIPVVRPSLPAASVAVTWSRMGSR